VQARRKSLTSHPWFPVRTNSTVTRSCSSSRAIATAVWKALWSWRLPVHN